MKTNSFVWREVIWQRPFTQENIHDVMKHIAALPSRSYLIWETRCSQNRIRYLIGCSPKSLSRVQEVFQSHGNVTFIEAPERKPATEAKALKLSHPVLSLNTDTVGSTTRAVLATMTGGKGKEETVIQVVIGGAFRPSAIPKTIPAPDTNFLDILLGKVRDATPEQRKIAKDKASQYSFACTVRVGQSGTHTATRIYNMISGIRTLESAGVHIRADSENPENLNQATLPWHMPLRLSVQELSAMMFLPAGEEELPGTPGLHPKEVRSPKWYKEPASNTDRTFAISCDPVPRKLSISPRDALEHTAILGPTGSGKSTAMQRLILADIHAGRSVLVIDPKADLVTDILARIPTKRKDDVVVLDPSDPCPVGFNPLAFKQDHALTADTILSVFQELFAENWGIRTADVLGAALNTLARIPKATLLWLIPLLTQDDFRKKIVAQIHDPVGLNSFWEHYEAMSVRERNTEIAPVLNKLRQISLRPGLRNVLGQSQPRFSLAELFSERRIVLVPLNKGLVGADTARLIGSLIVGLTWTLALSRANVAPEKRHLVSVYIDELQDYLSLPTSFSDALAQARGLGVGYTVAHQYRAQLPPDIKAGIDANCRNKIVFGLNSDDSKDMAAQAPELSALDFMTLPRYHIYTTFQSGGKSTGWISGKTLPPPEPVRLAAELKAESMKRYGTPAEEVEAELVRLMQPEEVHQVKNSAIGSKRPKASASPPVKKAPSDDTPKHSAIGRKKQQPRKDTT